MDMIQILKDAVEHHASDIFVIAGLPVSYKVNGTIIRTHQENLMPAQTETMVREIYALAGDRDLNHVTLEGDDDFSFSLKGISRFRVNAYRQRSSLAAVIRVVTFDLPDPHEIGIPDTVLNLADRTKGLVLVTGPAGSGKSTTLACMIDRINRTRSAHVITLEDPLEYLHKHNKSIVSQREISTDTESYVKALRSALRQAPDVILLGEMRDYETINVAMTAAETGHLIFSTLHTIGAANTIDRIIDAFPPNQQHQIRIQLSMVLQAVVSQQILPTVDGKEVPAFEIMLVNSAIRNMIRESKVHQIDTVIYSSAGEGMQSMDSSLLDLYQKNLIRQSDMLTYSTNPDQMLKKIKNM
ncbi:type IV pilus twitching motility protein PilT [Marasmitruncus massiliensis]|jgi:twitching motility protein PilT|uniref:type IV pilus twitching motility protein PilT n=1 Tax=Marasmitruncus massiliensis TaxID=1944642 RepID=UPI000C7A4C67|nr:PilT/PilU family type 4a pilus ATPase [Marasmitruncus massiliensis]MBE6907686.1 PilT/PilU family type 4a pilus ATPase [Oscillospiraceae bacterium]